MASGLSQAGLPERATLLLNDSRHSVTQTAGADQGWAASCGWFEAVGIDIRAPGLPHATLVVGYTDSVVERADGRWRGRGSPARPGVFTLIPPDEPHHYRSNGPTRSFQLYLPTPFLEGLGADTGQRHELRDDHIFAHDLELYAMLEAFSRRARLADVVSRLEMDARAVLIGLHLLGAHAATPWRSGRSRGGLAPWQLQRVDEMVSADLAADLGLRELAALTGLSVAHFSRAFKVSTGLSPHAYVIQRRLQRGRDLLSCTSLPVEQIAAELGFSSPAHFARMFRAHFLLSPREWRQLNRRTHHNAPKRTPTRG